MNKSRLADRPTPLTDAWVNRLRATVSPKHGGEHGLQSDLARHLCAIHGNPAPDHNALTRWVSQFSRWFRRTGLPGLEDYLCVEEWLAGRTAKLNPANTRKRGGGRDRR